MSSKCEKFINYLENLKTTQNKKTLAELRRGARCSDPTDATMIYPYVVKWLRGDWLWIDKCYCMVAILYALSPKHTNSNGNFGKSFNDANTKDSESFNNRFRLVVESTQDELFDNLKSAISLIRSRDKAINYKILLDDLIKWNNDDNDVQKKWASGFWINNS